MVARKPEGAKDWGRWLQAQLDRLDWDAGDLIKATGIGSSQVYRWLDGSIGAPRSPSIRQVCKALGVPAIEGMIAAGHNEPEDIGATVVQHVDPRALTKRQLLEEIARRIPDDAVSGDRPTAARPYVVRPTGVEGQDYAARRRHD